MKSNPSMEHPSEAQWAALVSGEAPRAERRQLKAHLAQCESCRARIHAWQGARELLDDWKVEPGQSPGQPAAHVPVLRWAAAALVVLALVITGFGAGRWLPATPGSTAAELATIKALLRAELIQDLEDAFAAREQAWLSAARNQGREMIAEAVTPVLAGQETLAGALARIEAAKDEEWRALWGALVRVETQARSELEGLRKDLETVAVVSEGYWTDARQSMIQLAARGQAGPSPVGSSGTD